MPYNDPLAVLSPVLQNNSFLNSLATKYGFTVLPQHFHEIVIAALLYESIFRLSHVYSPRLSSEYKTLSRRTQINFDIHVASQFQAILILIISFPLFFDEILKQDTLNAYTPYSGFVTAMATGYFLWDTYVCTRYVNLFGPGFLVHGVSALFVFIQSFRPYGLYYAPTFLFFELSTPFLNIHWFSTHLPSGFIPRSLQIVNGLMLLATFFFARILWGFYWAAVFAADVWQDRHTSVPPFWVPLAMLSSNVVLDFLNVHWFRKMIALAAKQLSGGGGHKAKAH
jgi:hypothetical protein